MIDFNKKYKLKRQYKFKIVDKCNYIVSLTGIKCAYLNPIPAYIFNCIISENNLHSIKKIISRTFSISEAEAVKEISKLYDKLSIYLEEDNKEKVVNPEVNKDILKCDGEFECPIKKAEHPRKIKFYLTDYCPRFCIYCFAGAKFAGKRKYNCDDFLSPDRFKDIIIEARDFGVTNIEISGGDPFVLNNIYEYLQIMIDCFPYDWGTSTKAFISKEEAKILADINLPEIQVSLDSFVPETADKMMGVKGAYNEVISTIKNLQEVGLDVTTKATITSINIYDIPDLFMNLVNMGINRLRFSYYYISANRHGDYLFPSNEQFVWLNEHMKEPLKYAEENGIKTDFFFHEPYDVSKNKNNRLVCGGFVETLCVRPDGGVLFCDSLNHCDDFVAGNLKTQGLKEFWNSTGINNMNDPMFFYEKYKGTKCYDCRLFKNCFYKRCYVRTFTKFGKYFDVDPACPFGEPDYIIK